MLRLLGVYVVQRLQYLVLVILKEINDKGTFNDNHEVESFNVAVHCNDLVLFKDPQCAVLHQLSLSHGSDLLKLFHIFYQF